jgi:hypothetical protein
VVFALAMNFGKFKLVVVKLLPDNIFPYAVPGCRFA